MRGRREPEELGPEYRVEYPINVVLTNAMFRCTKCKRWLPAAKFGLRCVTDSEGNEVVRNQPQCHDCRRRPPLRVVK